jgi:hypothetical protein
MKIKIEFSGGLELMFDKKKNIDIELKDDSILSDVIEELRKNHLKEKEEMFI